MKLRTILYAIAMLALLLTSCKESTKPSKPVVEKKVEYKFKKGDEVCVMGTFKGVVLYVSEFYHPDIVYRVDYVTPYGTKAENYYEYQLTAGACPKEE